MMTMKMINDDVDSSRCTAAGDFFRATRDQHNSPRRRQQVKHHRLCLAGLAFFFFFFYPLCF
jgi:hypothetical protein